MKTCKKCDTTKPLSEYNKNSRCADGFLTACKACNKLLRQALKDVNPEVYERQLERARKFKRANRDECIESTKQWRRDNVEEVKAYARAYEAANVGARAALNATRRALKVNATVAWGDKEIIKGLYIESTRLTAETGVQYHVDHIIPLKGKFVCGLHVETNLQVITATENLRKNNAFAV